MSYILSKASLEISYDRDNFSSQAQFFGMYLFFSFREFPLRITDDKTNLSSKTFKEANVDKNVTFNLLNNTTGLSLIDTVGIGNIQAKDLYFNDTLSEDTFKLGSIYLRQKIIFENISPNINVGINIKKLTLDASFKDATGNSEETRKYQPSIVSSIKDYAYNLSYLNGEKIYLVDVPKQS
jgi:hypothetical protein